MIHPRIIVSSIEHESILETARDLERQGIEIVYVSVNRAGIIDTTKLKDALDERTVLVSIQYANSEIGTIQPIRELVSIVKDYSPKILFHTDAVQAFQFLPCNVDELGVDLMTLSAHKIYGPKGIGVLYTRSLIPNTYSLIPLITGGGQEFGMRSGTENVPAIVGFGAAVAIAERVRKKEYARLSSLMGYFWRAFKKIIPDAQRNGSVDKHLPHLINIYFPGRPAHDLCVELDMAGLAVSPGTACSARAAQPSAVIRALGWDAERAASSVRFSLGRFTTKSEITRALTILADRFTKKVP